MDPATCRALGFREDGIADLSALGLPLEAIEARRKFIGGSDVNVICGGDEKEIAKLRAFKRGERASDDLSDMIHVMLGNWTEPFILAWAEKVLGQRITRRGERVHAARRPWMAATLDGWFADYPGGPRLAQVKHVNAFSKPDDVLARYAHTQVQHELHCADAEAALLIVLFGTLKFDIFEIQADLDVQAELIQAEKAFWDSVTGEAMPPIPSVTARAKVVKPVRVGEVDMTGNNEWADAAARWLQNREAAKTFDQAVKDIKAAVPGDAKRAHGHGIEVTASKSGALSIKPLSNDNEPAEAA